MQLRRVLLGLGVVGIVGWAYQIHASAKAREVPAQTTYYANGQLRSRIEFESGRRDGVGATWYSDGAKQAEGRYADGRMEGAWTFWLPDGSLDAERTGVYHEGRRLPSESDASRSGT